MTIKSWAILGVGLHYIEWDKARTIRFGHLRVFTENGKPWGWSGLGFGVSWIQE